jgi:hypothetical protein
LQGPSRAYVLKGVDEQMRQRASRWHYPVTAVISWSLMLAALLTDWEGPAHAGDVVLYCVETDARGFVWKGPNVSPIRFSPSRYTVKIDPDGRNRTITDMTTSGGRALQYDCNIDKLTLTTVCDASFGGGSPWMFYSDKSFTHAFLAGPPAGGTDPNIYISYGTCTKF